MYENGKRINHHKAMILHKQKCLKRLKNMYLGYTVDITRPWKCYTSALWVANTKALRKSERSQFKQEIKRFMHDDERDVFLSHKIWPMNNFIK